MNLVYALAAIAALFASCKGASDSSAPSETIPLETAAAKSGAPSDAAVASVSSEDLDGDPVQLHARDRREQAVHQGEPAVPAVSGRLDFARLKPKIRAHQLQLELNEGAR
jgi:hypothetical protein